MTSESGEAGERFIVRHIDGHYLVPVVEHGIHTVEGKLQLVDTAT